MVFFRVFILIKKKKKKKKRKKEEKRKNGYQAEPHVPVTMGSV
jgi:hypothetical protein